MVKHPKTGIAGGRSIVPENRLQRRKNSAPATCRTTADSMHQRHCDTLCSGLDWSVSGSVREMYQHESWAVIPMWP